MKINVLSVFDGMSCGQIALNELGFIINKYFACEIEPNAIKVTNDNYPDTIQLGDVTKVNIQSNGIIKSEKGVLGCVKHSGIDLLIGGSPCQGFSTAGKQLNFDYPRSKLFFEFVRLLKEAKPKYFLLENVWMKKEWQDVITMYLGVEPIEINSNLITGANRKRLYWTNIPNVTIPTKNDSKLSEVLESGNVDRDKAYCIDANYAKGSNLGMYFNKSRRQIVFEAEGKHEIREGKNYYYRLLSPIEVERLHGVPEGYTSSVAKTNRYHMLGNGWSVQVIKHIFKTLNFNIMTKKKNELKCEKVVMIKLDYSELERFIIEEFNVPNYDFIADEELNNDMTWTANVKPNEMEVKELLDFIRSGNGSYKTRRLLNQLCFEGKIEAGEYAVEICW